MNENDKYIKLGLIIAVVVGIGALVLFLISLIPQRVTITYNTVKGATVKVFKVDSDEDLHDLTDEKTIGKEVNNGVTSGKDIFLQRGAYVVSVSGDKIQKKQYPLEVSGEVKKDITITYSRQYLDTLMKEVEPTIIASLKSVLPTLESSYTIRPGKLYQTGDWYGARLRYIGTDQFNRDTLRVVMKKTDKGTWELVTKTPEIIVTHPKYPSIPDELIEDINSDEDIKIIPVDE